MHRKISFLSTPPEDLNNYHELWKIIIMDYILPSKIDFTNIVSTSTFFFYLCESVLEESTFSSYAVCNFDPVHDVLSSSSIKVISNKYDHLTFSLFSDKKSAQKEQSIRKSILRKEWIFNQANNDYFLKTTSYPFLFDVKSRVNPLEKSFAKGKFLFFYSASTKRTELKEFGVDKVKSKQEYQFDLRKKL